MAAASTESWPPVNGLPEGQPRQHLRDQLQLPAPSAPVTDSNRSARDQLADRAARGARTTK